MNTEVYYKHPVSDPVAAHFYRFRTNKELPEESGAVPDGAADIIFRCDCRAPQAFLAGGVRSKERNIFKADTDYFGVRLLPGMLERLRMISAKELGDRVADFADISGSPETVEEICVQDSFDKQIEMFAAVFLKPSGQDMKNMQAQICEAVLDVLYRCEGNCTMRQLEQELCYSRQHLSRVFKAFTGTEIKQLAMIIRFQSSLHKLNQDGGFSLAEFSVANGYYDQSHFQKEFQRFTGVTPAKYQALIRKYRYKDRIRLV